MKSIQKILSIWCTMFVFALYISSCCTTHLKIIGEGQISAKSLDQEIFTSTDTITGPFKIEVFAQLDIALNDLSELGFTKGLAIACNDEVINGIDIESIEISLDKAFQYKNSSFNAGLNLKSIEEVKTNITVVGHSLTITFDEDFFSKANFEKENYNFIIHYKTSDNISLSNEINLFLNI